MATPRAARPQVVAHLRPLLSLVLAAASCGDVPPPRSASHSGWRFVIVSAGATLHTRPDEGAPGVTLPAASPFRRIGVQDDWIVLETVTAASDQCTAAFAPPEGMSLRFYLHGETLERVIARPLTLRGPEGTLTVQSGVAVREIPGTASGAEIVHEGLRVRVVLEPTIAREYMEPRADRTLPRVERLAPGTRAALPDSASLEVERNALVYVVSSRPAGGDTRVTVVTRCVRFDAVVGADAVLPVRNVVFDEHVERPVARWRVRQGAALRWVDGSTAGRAIAAVTLSDEGRSLVGDRCFSVPLRYVGVADAPPLPVDVCVAERDVDRVGGP